MKPSIKFLVPAMTLLAAHFSGAAAEIARPADNGVTMLAALRAKAPLFVASTDSKHQNEDYVLLKPGETRRVPLPEGYMVRLWSTALEPDKIDLTLAGPTKNGETLVPIPVLRAGKAQRGTYEDKTFLWYPREEWGTILKGGSLTVRNHSKQPNKWFYQANIRPGAFGAAAVPATLAIQKGQPKLVVESKGPALLKSLSIKFKSKPDAAALQKIRILVSLQPAKEGAPTEVVDVPLGPLVGSFKGDAGPLQDAMTEWDGQNLTLHWPMPFDGARQKLAAEVTGAEATLEAAVAALPADIPYRFHAAFGSQRTEKKQPIPILKVTGEGAFAGLRLSSAPSADSARRAFAYLEGNEILVADGKTYEGTGTEDFFNSAWYFPEKTFARPYGGLTERTALPPSVSMYRLMIPDALPFKRDFKFDFEVGRQNNANDLEYRWVAFWYQKESGTVAIEDALNGSGGDTSMNPLTSRRVDNTPNGVKSLPDMPVGVEIVVGLVLLAGVVLALSAVFRRKKN